MPQLASWIRESDQENFSRFLNRSPEVTLHNARLEPFDLREMDGLLVTGGPDISAEFLRQASIDPSLIQDPDPVRDAWEFAAIESAYARGLPILAVCKGVQALNVALGGTLLLDIRGHDLPEMKLSNCQPLKLTAAARHRFACVNSSHHQAIDRLASPLEIEAWHAEDEVIEQVRIRNYPWGLGVQYHPERDSGAVSLFDDFLAQLKRRP